MSSGDVRPYNLRRFLLGLPLFARARAETVDALVRASDRVRLPRHTPLWDAGERLDAVFLLRSGVVRRQVKTADEKRLIVGFHARGALLGEMAMLVPGAQYTDAVAHEDSTVFQMKASSFLRALERDSRLRAGVVSMAIQRRRDAEERLAALLNRSANGRLAYALVDLVKQFGVRDSRGSIIDLRLTHRDLASLVGVARETVSVAIGELRRSGLVQVDGRRLIIVDLERVRALAQ